MKLLFVFLYLIHYILSKENFSGCNKESTLDEVSTLDQCSAIEIDEENKCCIVVYSLFGKNHFYCSEFNKSAEQYEIDSKIKNDTIDVFNKLFPGAIVKVKASCTQDVEPFKGNKCSIEDTQSNENFGSCANYNKNVSSDYCCLFSGKVSEKESSRYTDVYFCEEIEHYEIDDMEETATKIDRGSEMFDVAYIKCNPDRPIITPIYPISGFYLNYNKFFFISLILFFF